MLSERPTSKTRSVSLIKSRWWFSDVITQRPYSIVSGLVLKEEYGWPLLEAWAWSLKYKEIMWLELNCINLSFIEIKRGTTIFTCATERATWEKWQQYHFPCIVSLY